MSINPRTALTLEALGRVGSEDVALSLNPAIYSDELIRRTAIAYSSHIDVGGAGVVLMRATGDKARSALQKFLVDLVVAVRQS
jgi:hypothetical protein